MGPGAVALLPGAGMVTRSNDTEFPFRQDSDFWYLTGFDHPDAVAVLRTDGGPAYTLFVQPREPEAETWTGRRPGVEGARRDYGADEARPVGELPERLPELLGGARRLYHVLGRDAELDRRLIGALEGLRRRTRSGAEPPAEIVDPRPIVHEMRLVKEATELDLMREAADITREAHGEAARLARPGRFEYELEAVLDWVFRRRGGWGPAYGSIVGSGPNATILHHVRNDRRMRDGELVLIDAGAEYRGYAADVTRTYPVGGRFSAPARQVYEAVLDAQLHALSLCRPGTTLDAIHEGTVRRLVERMVDLGLLAGEVDGLLEQGAYRPYYMHRTGHWLGLDVHDAGAYTVKGEPRVLEPGMVFTVEPGIYVAPDAADAPEPLRGLGVRIEDDVVVTADGIEILSAGVPKGADDIEAWTRDA